MQDDFGDQVIRGYYSGRMVWPDVEHPLMYSKNFETKTFLVHPDDPMHMECFKHIQEK